MDIVREKEYLKIALLLACIHCDIFLDYDKIIDIYAFTYQRRMLLINPPPKNRRRMLSINPISKN